ncbi:MAG: hypothetical protein H6591_05235 [Flavobacteriales bacterium]|nr:hypothetical protein [Flavobacteriales bacterium]
MILRPRLLLAGLTFLSLSVLAQPPGSSDDKVKVKVRMGEKHTPDGSMMPYRVVRATPSSYVVLRSPDFGDKAFTKKSPRLDSYDRAKLSYQRSLEPLLERRGQERLLLEDLVVMNGKPTLIARTGGQEEIALYYQHVEPNITRQPPAFDRICAFPVEVKGRQAMYEHAGKSTRVKWSTSTAADGSHLLIHSPELRGASDEPPFYLLAVVDQQMQVKWQHIMRVDGGSERSDVLDAAVDAEGNAYLVIRYRYRDGAPVGGADDYQVVLHKVNADDIARVPFTMDAGYYPTGGILQPIGKDRLAYAGIYASSSDDGRMLGNFIAWVDSSEGGLSAPTLYPFSEQNELDEQERLGIAETKADSEAKNEKQEQKRLYPATDVIGLIAKDDGGFYVVNEVALEASWINPETARRYQRFYHGPVQARSLGKDGQVQWSTLVRRWVMTDDPTMGRAFPVAFDDQLFVFLWDSESNIEARKSGEKIVPKQSMSGLYSAYAYFDPKGGYRTKPVLRSGNDEALMTGWELTQTGPGEFMAFATGSAIDIDYLPARIEFSKETKK